MQCRTNGVAETTFTDLAPGQYTVIEAAPLGADLANYESFWRCDADFQSGTTFSVSIATGQQAGCVFLNHLAHSGTLEVQKHCQGNTTADRFHITLVDTGLTLDIACGGRFDLLVPPGSYTLVETAASGTDASAYRTVFWCQNGQTRPPARAVPACRGSSCEKACRPSAR